MLNRSTLLIPSLTVFFLLMMFSYPMMAVLVGGSFFLILGGQTIKPFPQLLVIFGLSLLISLIDINQTYYADVIRYYYYYINHDDYVFYNLQTLKLYRVFVFYTLKFFGLNEGMYTFLSLFIMFSSFYFATSSHLRNSGFNCRGFEFRVIYCLVFLSAIPFHTYLNFEMMLGISLFYLGMTKFIYKKRKIGIIVMITSCTVHVSLLLPCLLFYISRLFEVKYLIYISFFIIASLLVMKLTPVHTGVSILDKLFLKYYNYSAGYWSRYERLQDKILLIYILIKYVLSFFLLFRAKKNENIEYGYYKFLLFYLLVTLPLISSRTMALRLIYLPFIFFAPLMLHYLYSKSCIVKRYLVFYILICTSISFNNVLYFRSTVNNMIYGSDYIVFMDWVDIYEFKMNMPDKKLLFDTRKNFE